MKLVHLVCQNIGIVPDGEYSFCDPRTGRPLDVVLVTGPAASGKTTLLRAIAAAKEAAGPYGTPPTGKELLRVGEPAGLLETTWELDPAERSAVGTTLARCTTRWELRERGGLCECDPMLRRLLRQFSRSPEVGKFELFPAGRRLLSGSWRPAPPAPSAGGLARLRLSVDPEKYLTLPRVFEHAALEDAVQIGRSLSESGVATRQTLPDRLEPLKVAIAAMLPDLRLVRVDVNDGEARVWFRRRDRQEVPLEALSESEQQGVLFALAFEYLGLNRSIVLVDTPELHVHPAQQARFFAALASLGHDNQLLVSTTSAELLATVPYTQILELTQAPRRLVA